RDGGGEQAAGACQGERGGTQRQDTPRHGAAAAGGLDGGGGGRVSLHKGERGASAPRVPSRWRWQRDALGGLTPPARQPRGAHRRRRGFFGSGCGDATFSPFSSMILLRHTIASS